MYKKSNDDKEILKIKNNILFLKYKIIFLFLSKEIILLFKMT